MFSLTDDEKKEFFELGWFDGYLNQEGFYSTEDRREKLNIMNEVFKCMKNDDYYMFIHDIHAGHICIPFSSDTEYNHDGSSVCDDDDELVKSRCAINDMLTYISAMDKDTPYLKNLADIVIPYCASVINGDNVDDFMMQAYEHEDEDYSSDCDHCECDEEPSSECNNI